MNGVILYGPPAAGKDTITAALSALDKRYALFRRLKVGGGRMTGYRPATTDDLARLRQQGAVVWENSRYGASYAVDLPGLADALAERIPVLHLGQPDAVPAIVSATPGARWVIAYVWCPRSVAEERIIARSTGDTGERLRAWDETPVLSGADLTIDTTQRTPAESARAIHSYVQRLTPADQPG